MICRTWITKTQNVDHEKLNCVDAVVVGKQSVPTWFYIRINGIVTLFEHMTWAHTSAKDLNVVLMLKAWNLIQVA